MAGKGAARREKILDAAVGILTERGYGEFGLRTVAAASAMRLSHVQYYFPTVDGLLDALVERVLADADARVQALPAGDVSALLTMLLDEQEMDAPCRLVWELWSLAGRHEGANAALLAFYDGYITRMVEAIACSCPALPSDQRRDRAALIVALVEGMSVLRGLGRSPILAPHGRMGTVAAARAILDIPST
jgi:AcrR family transcriptional regulator